MVGANNMKRCCQTLESMGECGDGAHRLGVFFLDGTPPEHLREKRDMLVDEIRKKMMLIAAIDSKLKQGYTVSDVDARLAKDDIKQKLDKIDKAEREYRAGRLHQASEDETSKMVGETGRLYRPSRLSPQTSAPLGVSLREVL